MIEKIIINGKEFYSWNHEMISKGMSFMIRVYHDNQITGDSFLLSIIDTNYKKRLYILKHDGSMVRSISEMDNILS